MVDGDKLELVKQLEKVVKKTKVKIDTIDEQIEKLQRQRAELMEEWEPANRLMQKYKGAQKATATVAQASLSGQGDLSRFSIKKAALAVLAEVNRRMSSREIAEEMERRGKKISGAHGVYIVSMALKQVPDKVRRVKEGRTNYFEFKREGEEK